MKTILFVCVQNSCRSQMAEGFARSMGAGVIEPYSAGSSPSGMVNPTAVKVMGEKGIDISGQRSKKFDDLPVKQVDYLVTMGCNDVCPIFPAVKRLEWDLDDPAGRPIGEFRRVRDQIEAEIISLIKAIKNSDTASPGVDLHFKGESIMTNPFQGKGMVIAGMIHIAGSEALQAARDGALFLDLRSPLETGYKKFAVPEVLYIPGEELQTRIGEIPRDRPVIVADSVGLRSKNAVKQLLELGFTNVANLNGGILDWEHDGMPIMVDLDKQLSGSCTCRLKPQKSQG